MLRKNREQAPPMEKSTFTQEYAVFRTVLREYRERAGVTQVALAEELGETQSFISKCERGERRLDLVQLLGFCRVLKVPLGTFVETFLARLKAQPASGRTPKTKPARS